MPNKKAGPQFANANEEPAYRSAVQNSPAICVLFCVFFYLVGNKSLIPPNDPNTDEAS